MDVNNGVVSYTRRVDALSVSCVLKEDKDKDSPYDMCVLTIGTGANQINHNNSLSSKKYEFTNRNLQGRYNRNPRIFVLNKCCIILEKYSVTQYP